MHFSMLLWWQPSSRLSYRSTINVVARQNEKPALKAHDLPTKISSKLLRGIGGGAAQQNGYYKDTMNLEVGLKFNIM